MAPAIPARARLRVRVQGNQPCRRGDVVYYLAGDGYMVHRVVFRARRGAARDLLLTCGDGCLAPDPPVRSDQVLGTVIAVETPDGWRPPGPPITPGPLYRRLVRALALAGTIAALGVSASTARRLALSLHQLEAASRTTVRGIRRRLRSG
jgi:hypothetical protein